MSHASQESTGSASRTVGRRILLILALLGGGVLLLAFGYRAVGQSELESSVAKLEAALGVEVDRTPEPVPEEDLLPTLRQARDLHEAAEEDLAAGDYAAAVGRAEEIADLRRHLLEDPYFLHQLVARAIDSELLDLAHAMVGNPQVGAETLRSLRALFPADEDEIRWSESIAREASLAFRTVDSGDFDLRQFLNSPWERASHVRLWLAYEEALRKPVFDVRQHLLDSVGEIPAIAQPTGRFLIPNLAVTALRHRGSLLVRALARAAIDLRLLILAKESGTFDFPPIDLFAGGDILLEDTEEGTLLDAIDARRFVRERVPEPASSEAITLHDLHFTWTIPDATPAQSAEPSPDAISSSAPEE